MSAEAAASRCVHLRTKAMYIHSYAATAFDDEQDEPVCWCNRTLRELGPDGDPAEARSCSDPSRGCYHLRP